MAIQKIIPLPIVNVAMAVMSAASNSSSPSALELASRTHKSVFFWYMCWLAVAAIATLFFTWALWKSSNRQQAAAKTEADLRVLKVEQTVADSKKATAEAIARAAEAQLALEKFKAPRTLTPEQRGRIVDKLKQFSGTEYDITISDADPEILSFVFTLELVLSTAGWTELDWKGTGEALIRGGKQPLIRLGVSVANVSIGVQTDQPTKLFEFALALSDALEAEGVTSTAERHIGHKMSSTNANAIHIMIGRKQ
jgi:hypothetical protein